MKKIIMAIAVLVMAYPFELPDSHEGEGSEVIDVDRGITRKECSYGTYVIHENYKASWDVDYDKEEFYYTVKFNEEYYRKHIFKEKAAYLCFSTGISNIKYNSPGLKYTDSTGADVVFEEGSYKIGSDRTITISYKDASEEMKLAISYMTIESDGYYWVDSVS